MLKQLFSALAGFVLVLAPVQAQVPTQSDKAPAIWAMSDDDNTVYLLGTVHILKPETEWRTPLFEVVLGDVEQVWFEADTSSDEANAEMARLIPQLAANTSGIPLSQMISDQAREDLAVIAGRLGAQPAQLSAGLDPFQPWLASLQLAVLQMQAAGFDPASGVEMVLHQHLSGRDVEKRYLETVEEQLRFFADMPLETQLSNFELGLREAVENPDMLDNLVAAWASGDMAELNRIMNEDMREQTPELYEAILVNRNHNWAPDIAAALDGDDDVLIAVGAGHMPGDQGVIALLQAQGLDVRRIQ